LRNVRVAVPFVLKHDIARMLREGAQVDRLLARAARSRRIDEAHRLVRDAPTLAQLLRWQPTPRWSLGGCSRRWLARAAHTSLAT
jgi:hypothetical protein